MKYNLYVAQQYNLNIKRIMHELSCFTIDLHVIAHLPVEEGAFFSPTNPSFWSMWMPRRYAQEPFASWTQRWRLLLPTTHPSSPPAISSRQPPGWTTRRSGVPPTARQSCQQHPLLRRHRCSISVLPIGPFPTGLSDRVDSRRWMIHYYHHYRHCHH